MIGDLPDPTRLRRQTGPPFPVMAAAWSATSLTPWGRVRISMSSSSTPMATAKAFFWAVRLHKLFPTYSVTVQCGSPASLSRALRSRARRLGRGLVGALARPDEGDQGGQLEAPGVALAVPLLGPLAGGPVDHGAELGVAMVALWLLPGSMKPHSQPLDSPSQSVLNP